MLQYLYPATRAVLLEQPGASAGVGALGLQEEGATLGGQVLLHRLWTGDEPLTEGVLHHRPRADRTALLR